MSRHMIRLYRGNGFVGLTVPRFNVTLLSTWAWLYPGWWFCGRVAGAVIVRAGPCVLTWWRF